MAMEAVKDWITGEGEGFKNGRNRVNEVVAGGWGTLRASGRTLEPEDEDLYL
jgi:hypothetical protein